jgi:hypothetical protein
MSKRPPAKGNKIAFVKASSARHTGAGLIARSVGQPDGDDPALNLPRPGAFSRIANRWDSTPWATAGRAAGLRGRPAVDEDIGRPADHDAATPVCSARNRRRAPVDENVV